MSEHGNFHLSTNSFFRRDIAVWWDSLAFPAVRYDVIGEAELTELMTRWQYVKAQMTATYQVQEKDEQGNPRTFLSGPRKGQPVMKDLHLPIDAAAPLLAVSRDTGEAHYLATHGQGFTVHEPQAWLTETVLPLIDEASKHGVLVESAIHLGMGKQTGITMSRETVDIDGLIVRPVFSLLTSQTGALATSASEEQVIVVCDNTAKMSEAGAFFKVKHTANSLIRLEDFQAALYTYVERDLKAATAWVGMLSTTPINSDEYREILETWAPSPSGEKTDTKGDKNLRTRRQTIHDELWRMWADPTETRVNPWAGTALGAYQALSTWDHFNSQIRGQARAEKLAIGRLTAGLPTSTDTTHDRVIATLARAVPSLADRFAVSA
jgi:Domain of unknown function (DUF932)